MINIYFIFLANKNPAPNQYPQKQLIGQIFNSKYKSYVPQTMHGKCDPIETRRSYPGPGKYKNLSEFGIYEAKNAQDIDKKLEEKYKIIDEKMQEKKFKKN